MVFQREKSIEEEHEGSKARYEEAEAGPSVLYPGQHDDQPSPCTSHLKHARTLNLNRRDAGTR